MKRGNLLLITVSCWIRQDPTRGGEIDHYPRGTILIQLQNDDPQLHHHKILTSDGKIGWIDKNNIKIIQ